MRIGIIGFGNMGSSLFKLLSKNGYEHHVILSDRKKHLLEKKRSKATIDNLETSSIIFLTIKPKDIQVLKYLKSSDKKLLVSCVAGVSIKDIEKYTNLPAIRMMANLPIQDGKGTIVYTKNDIVKKDKLEIFLNICKGPEIIYMDENKLDISTILAGSMPGFISHLSKEYINFGTDNGLSKEESLRLYISSLEGSASMMKTHSLNDIIHRVSSPGGVTAEGIKYLEDNNINEKIKKSLEISFQKIKRLKD